MIIRHYRILHDLHTLHEPPRQRLSAAGRFWATYLTAVGMIALWWLL